MKTLLILSSLLLTFGLSAQTISVTSSNKFITSGTACGKQYRAVFNYTKTVSQGWGWKTNSYPLTVSTTNYVQLAYLGKYGDTGTNCGGTMTIPPVSPAYRFSVYVATTNSPTQTITLTGFNP